MADNNEAQRNFLDMELAGSKQMFRRIDQVDSVLEIDEPAWKDPRPVFTRSPRQYSSYPKDTLKLLPPPPSPTQPTVSLVSIFVPVIGIWLSIIIQVIAAQLSSGSGRMPVTAFVSAPMALITVGFGIWNGRKTKAKYQADLKRRIKVYDDYIANQTKTIEDWKKKQFEAMTTPNPTLEECVQRAEVGYSLASEAPELFNKPDPQTMMVRKSSAGGNRVDEMEKEQRLWEREPAHLDFLHLRLGLGEVARSFTIEPPPTPPLTLEEDDLIKKGIKLEEDTRMLPQFPILLPLNKTGSVGVIGGTPDERMRMVHSLIMQIATHHAPNDVKLVMVVRKSEYDQWRWVRWLPHNWSDDRKVRFFVTGGSKAARETRHTLLADLEATLQQRKTLNSDAKANPEKTIDQRPTYVFVFADRNMWSGPTALQYGPLIDLLFNEGLNLGAYSIFTAGHRSQIPKDCKSVVHLKREVKNDPLTGKFELVGPVPEIHPFDPELAETSQSRKLASILAQIRVEQTIAQVPSNVVLRDLFPGIARISNLNISALWENSTPWMSLLTPIGKKTTGDIPAFINLQESSKPDGFGSHAMIGGTTGTGKTKFLQTLILLMCANFDPRMVNFVLIDYKGGDLAKGLDQLPHLVGSLANVESQGRQSDLIQRLFTSFEVEIQRRKRILKGENINDYMERWNRLKDTEQSIEPLPHLFLVIDEFAELLARNPNDDPAKSLMKRLMSIAAIGRSIGIHLILATQNPGTVVTEDLRNNINTRICLRMGTREASKSILNRYDAFYNITKDQIGRAYIQVGNNDRFELVQVAWGGAKDVPIETNQEAGISQVTLNGKRISHKKHDDNDLPEQMEVLASLICEAAKNKKIPTQTAVWLPMLPDSLELHEVRHERGWNGSGWGLIENWLAPVVGVVDYPAIRQQPPMTVDLAKEGHLLIHGGPVSGKTTLLQTLITSLILDHSPKEVHLYLLDFGVQNLRLFEGFPHVGAVISASEVERVRRFFTHLGNMIEERKKVLGGEIPNIRKLREMKPDQALPEVVVIIDNFTTFYNLFYEKIPTPEYDQIKLIVNEGAALGIHLVATTSSPTFPAAIREKIGHVICLEMTNPQHYFDSIGRTGGLFPAANTPGRGLYRMEMVVEFQTARVGPKQEKTKQDDSQLPVQDGERLQWLKFLQEQMRLFAQKNLELKPYLPLCIPSQPEKIDLGALLSSLPASLDSTGISYPVGLNMSHPTLQPMIIDHSEIPHFWVIGPSLSGRTTFLRNCLLAIAARYTPDKAQFVLFDSEESGISEFKGFGHACHVFTNVSDQNNIESILQETLFQEFPHPAVDPFGPHQQGLDLGQNNDFFTQVEWPKPEIFIVIDDLGLIRPKMKDSLKVYLGDLAKKQKRVHFIIAGTHSDFTGSGSLEMIVRKQRTGFFLMFNDWSTVCASMSILKPNPADTTRPVVIGNGFFFQSGQLRASITTPPDGVGKGKMKSWYESYCSESKNHARVF